ncbi:Polyketide synthase [Hondaea fermentalgiana]|uniref:Polyketide synthase n=1 Tax=Hondaea fermentalgiana TaxID=2315210 RepID=A0A2R5GD68_9STRA|nr:Polyketide synthase [Hondaea fermentalgiana]|eukprot:GBG25744.1 Polyketide synthase [Hondaea fermentalgiana]
MLVKMSDANAHGGDLFAEDNDLSRQHWVLPAKGGDIAALKVEHVAAMEEPVHGELTVRIEAIGLNFADIFTGLGLYSPVQRGEIKGRFVPGLEFAGVVERIGSPENSKCPDTLQGEEQLKHGHQLVQLSEQVWKIARSEASRFKVGDRVMGATRFGAYATRINVPAHQVRRVPDGWTFQQAAAFPVQSLTAYYALKELGGLRAGKVVLVHSAAGGCGMQALEICQRYGTYVIGTVGSESKVAGLLDRFPSLDARQIIVRDPTPSGFAKQLDTALQYLQKCRNANASGIDIVLDAVMGPYFEPAFKLLKPTGRYIVFGAASMTPPSDNLGVSDWLRLAWQYIQRPKVDPFDMISSNRSVMGFNLIHCLNDAETLMSLFEEIEGLDLPPPHVGREFKFHELVTAMRCFRSGNTSGKVVLTC